VLEAALSIHAVEAEHASALADLVAPGTHLFAPEAFATPRTPDQVMQIVAPFFMGAMPAVRAMPGAPGVPAVPAMPATPAQPAAGNGAPRGGLFQPRRLGDG